MERVPEPELMDEAEQAAAYARADFASVNQGFVDRFRALFPGVTGRVVDLGCGPGDISFRLARAAAALRVVAVDGSAAMLAWARRAAAGAPVASRVDLVRAVVPRLPFPPRRFDAVISNSLLHHLHRPAAFWDTVVTCGHRGAPVLIMDLFRPDSIERARDIVESGAANEAPVLKRDFFHSLLAAFTLEEVRAQLPSALRHARCEIVSERHWLLWGRLES
jgi:SAM-dependent methyltransferase